MSEEILDLSRDTSGGGLDVDPAGDEGFDFESLEGGGDEQHGIASESIDDRDPLGAGGDGEEESGGEWYDDLPDELREKVIAKGYRSIEDLARGYVGAESQLGSFSSEIGELRDAVANLASSRGGDEPRHSGEPQNPIPTMSQVAAWGEGIAKDIDEGRMDVGEGIAKLVGAMAGVSEAREQYLMDKFEERMAERTAPLEQDSFRTQVGREINDIKRTIGEEAYREYEPQVKQLLQTWELQQPGFVTNARAIRAAFGEVAFLSQGQQRRERGSRVLDRSARSGSKRGPSKAQQIVDEMDALNPSGLGGGL